MCKNLTMYRGPGKVCFLEGERRLRRKGGPHGSVLHYVIIQGVSYVIDRRDGQRRPHPAVMTAFDLLHGELAHNYEEF